MQGHYAGAETAWKRVLGLAEKEPNSHREAAMALSNLGSVLESQVGVCSSFLPCAGWLNAAIRPPLYFHHTVNGVFAIIGSGGVV